jgi:hypothetical protein
MGTLYEDYRYRQDRIELLQVLRHVLASSDPIQTLDKIINDLSRPVESYEGEFFIAHYEDIINNRWKSWVENSKKEC